MKKLLLPCALIVSFSSLGQKITNEQFEQSMSKWVYHFSGNPIDGSERNAFRINNEFGEDQDILFILKIQNTAETIKINNSIGEKGNNRDNIIISLKSAIDTKSIDEILMYFDNQNKYYKVNFRTFGSNGILWWNGISNDKSEFISRFDLINLLKAKDKVFFRFKYKDKADVNISFSLNGSSSIINKVVDLSNFTKNNESYMEMITGALRLQSTLDKIEKKGDILKLGMNRDELYKALNTYLFKTFGDFVYTFTIFNYKGNLNLEVLDLNESSLILIDLNQIH